MRRRAHRHPRQGWPGVPFGFPGVPQGGGAVLIQANVLRITTTWAQLAFSSTPTAMRDRYVPAQLDITHTPAQLSIKQTNIRCEIDSSACFAEEGHKTVTQLTAEYAAGGMEDIRQAAQEATDEEWEAIEAAPHTNFIRQVAKSKSMGAMQDVALTFIPSVRPTITWVPNELDVNFQPAQLNVDWQTTLTADVQVLQRGTVQYWMAQYPSVDIEYVGDQTQHQLDERA